MKTYEEALFDVHKVLSNDISKKIGQKDHEYINGMLDAAQVVLTMIMCEANKKEGENND